MNTDTMPRIDVVLDHATLLTMDDGRPGPLAGPMQGRVDRIDDGAIAVAGGRIAAVGPRDGVWRHVDAARAGRAELGGGAMDVVDAAGRVVLPGLVDAHTHLVWAGTRADEFEARLTGTSYLDLLANGGGINATVRATRAASFDDLVARMTARLDVLVDHGVTTVEVKTGYGLTVDEEMRHLDVIAAAASAHPARVVPTFLGAHALPSAYAGAHAPDRGAFVREVIGMLPRVAAHPLGRRGPLFCDVFCDAGAFDVAETRAVLTAAKAAGLGLKVHSDEFENLGATALAAELGATSADHLVATTPAEMAALARSGTVAVLLPVTTIGLGSTHFADGAAFVRHGAPVALASDWNPGTAPCPNLWLALAIGTRYGRLSVAEALVAVTRNAACAVGRDAVAGRLAVGRPADAVLTDSDDPRELAYGFGTNRAVRVMLGGRWVR
ncbi:MAG: imidazolonepropionase [Ardenticatenales bacterium]|nr:imidazolonepropionase [Ardenticatenales bacterium]